MTDQNTVLIILGIIFVVATVLIIKNTNKKNKTITPPTKINKEKFNQLEEKYLIPDIEKQINKPNINRVFLDTQFHNDYRDVFTAIGNMVPSHKQLFNISNQPVKYEEPPEQEAYELVRDFILDLNENVLNTPNFLNANSGWDEPLQQELPDSGWEKQRKHLGLSPSLYKKPAERAPLKLIDIQRVQRYDTESEARIVVHMILQKETSKDQIVLTVSFMIDKNNLHDENNFGKNKYKSEVNVFIEEIFVEGFLSNEGEDMRVLKELTKSKEADFIGLEGNQITPNEVVIDELNKQYKKRVKEMEFRNSILDDDALEIRDSSYSLSNMKSFQNTRNIYDDLQNKPINYY